jgi:DNA-directed RNA polymerase beta' subunit
MVIRQPSLHRFNTMVFKVYILPADKRNDNTMKLNWFITTPYNADFDGDEMSFYVIQDELSQAEMV